VETFGLPEEANKEEAKEEQHSADEFLALEAAVPTVKWVEEVDGRGHTDQHGETGQEKKVADRQEEAVKEQYHAKEQKQKPEENQTHAQLFLWRNKTVHCGAARRGVLQLP